jgi:LysM repeat protein
LNTTPSNNLNSPAIGVTDVLQAPVKLDPTYEGQITIGGSDNTDFENEETGNLKDEFETETANESSNYPDVAKSTKLKATKPKSHITKRGESLYTISQKYGISLNDLYKINKMSAKTRLDVGQKIKLSK